jgi:hypothetical protein
LVSPKSKLSPPLFRGFFICEPLVRLKRIQYPRLRWLSARHAPRPRNARSPPGGPPITRIRHQASATSDERLGGPGDGGAVWIYTRSGGPGASRAVSWSARALSETPGKASPSRYPPMATPPSWADRKTPPTSGRRGSTAATAVSRASMAGSWPPSMRVQPPDKAGPSPCLPTGTPPSRRA